MIKSRRRMVAGALGLALLAGCGGTAGRPAATGTSTGKTGGTVTVFAAASLTESFQRLATTFEKEHPGTKVRFNFGASSTLAQQINQGAPADVFAAASPATMKQVTDAGGTSGTPKVFVRNRLEIAVPKNNPAKVTKLADLANPKVKVALCAPQVPCGAAADKALAAAGLKVRPATLESDVKATLTKVRLGEVDAALVYHTDVVSAGSEVTGIPFPEADKAINDYPIVVLAHAPNPQGAKDFVALVESKAGRDELTRVGFEVP